MCQVCFCCTHTTLAHTTHAPLLTVAQLLECESSSGLSSTFTWAPLRTISSSELWECVQAFLLPRLLRLRSMCKSAAIAPEEPKECGVLFDPEPHAFRPWRKDFVLDWRHSKASGQVSGKMGQMHWSNAPCTACTAFPAQLRACG